MEQDSLQKLNALVTRYEELESEIFMAENLLEDLNKELLAISRGRIPELLNEAQLSEVKIASGKKIVVKDKVHASIAKSRIHEAYTQMVEAEEDDTAKEATRGLFKEQLTLSDTSEETKQMLIDSGVPYEEALTIHHQTLGKYCRQRLESGQTVPEAISVFQYQETKIK